MTSLRVGDRTIGAGHPCFLAAEIGINHNGDLELAHRMIDTAADAGVDAVKFQNYRTEDFLSDRSLAYEYISQGKEVRESQFAMFKRCELSTEGLLALRKHCDRRGIVFFSTPTSDEGVTALVKMGAPLLKNGSDYLVHLPLIRAMARSGLPTVLSTGMATLSEIDEAVRGFREAGGQDLLLLHCTSSYPTPPEDVHLRKIPVLEAAFGCPVGLSDHTEGTVAAIGGVTLGACVLEKHFTLDKQLPGPDHRFSADPREVRALVQAVRSLEKCLGKSVIGPTPSEAEGRLGFRLSCVADRDVKAGEALTESDIAFRRPGGGLSPALVSWVIHRRLRRDVSRGKVLEPSDLS